MSKRELLECPYCGKKFYDNCNPLEHQLAASQAREAELRKCVAELLYFVPYEKPEMGPLPHWIVEIKQRAQECLKKVDAMKGGDA